MAIAVASRPLCNKEELSHRIAHFCVIARVTVSACLAEKWIAVLWAGKWFGSLSVFPP
jgi:hypothetical protein